MKKFTAIILAAFLSVAAFSACSGKNGIYAKYEKFIAADDNGDAGWHIRAAKEGGERYEQKVGLTVSRSGKTVSDAYIKIASFDKNVESVVMKITKYSATSEKGFTEDSSQNPFVRELTADEFAKAKKESDGWVKINSEQIGASTYSNVMFASAGGFTVKEIAFLSDGGELLSAKVNDADFWYMPTVGENLSGSGYKDKSKIEKITDSSDGLPTAIADAQEYYKNKVETIKKAAEVSVAPKEWKVEKVDGTEENPLGQKAAFNVTRGDGAVKEFWIKVNEVEGESAKISFAKSSGVEFASGATAVEKTITGDMLSENGGWIKITDDDFEEKSNYYALHLNGGLTIEEAAFIGENGYMSFVLYKATFTYTTVDGNLKTVENLTRAAVLNLMNASGGTPAALYDDADAAKGFFANK